MKKKLPILIILSLILTACGNAKVKNEFIDQLNYSNLIDVNNSIELKLDPLVENTLLIGDIIHIEVVNNSNSSIYFPVDRNIQIFILDKTKGWQKIDNSINYYGNGIILAPRNEEGFHTSSAVFMPMIEKDNKKTNIRVVVAGYLENGSIITDEIVCSYLDLKISP